MKKILLAFSMGVLGTSWGQRNMDFMTMILSPANNEEITVNQTSGFTIEMMNDGSEDFLASDSLYIYVTVDGTELIFQPDNTDHKSRTGNAIAANGIYDFSFPMIFTSGFEGAHDICFRIIPVNGADEIIETAPADNTACVTIVVVSNNAGLEESETNSVMVYPNPANNSFVLSENMNHATVTDINGSIIPFEMVNGTVDCSSWSNGCYFVHLSGDQNRITKRIIVSH